MSHLRVHFQGSRAPSQSLTVRLPGIFSDLAVLGKVISCWKTLDVYPQAHTLSLWLSHVYPAHLMSHKEPALIPPPLTSLQFQSQHHLLDSYQTRPELVALTQYPGPENCAGTCGMKESYLLEPPEERASGGGLVYLKGES